MCDRSGLWGGDKHHMWQWGDESLKQFKFQKRTSNFHSGFTICTTNLLQSVSEKTNQLFKPNLCNPTILRRTLFNHFRKYRSLTFIVSLFIYLTLSKACKDTIPNIIEVLFVIKESIYIAYWNLKNSLQKNKLYLRYKSSFDSFPGFFSRRTWQIFHQSFCYLQSPNCLLSLVWHF